MKRILFVISATLLIGVGSEWPGGAFQKPSRAPLPNLDRRLANPAPGAAALPEAAASLKARVPELQIATDNILGKPRFFYSRTGFLTGPNGEGLALQAASLVPLAPDDRHRVIKAFLNEHAGLLGYDATVLATAAIKREYVTEHNGLRTVIWEQQLDSIPVFDALLMAHITRQGELVNLSTHFVANPADAAAAGLKNRAAIQATPPISAAQAIVNAAHNVGDNGLVATQVMPLGAPQGADRQQKFNARPALTGETDTRLVWLPLNGSVLHLCWQVILTSRARGGEMFLVVVDAVSGEVQVRRCLTNYLTDASYRVFTSDSPSPFTPGHPFPMTNQPPIVPRQLVVTPALNTNASPNGWIDDNMNETLGNNVDAHTDINGDDMPDLPRPAGNPARVFDFNLDLTQHPTNSSPAAVVQLFYLNNWYHDKLWEMGFTEAAGNFQTTNFNRGGLGNDAVIADAQDNYAVNNAFMSTPPDGLPPRMIMCLYTGPTPFRDSCYDADVVLHEYTHGLSNRRVGGGVGIWQLQSSGQGEGWSDFCELAFLSEPTDNPDAVYPHGGYLAYMDLYPMFPPFLENYYFGGRRYPYTTDLFKNPLTFKDIDPTQASTHPGIPIHPIWGPMGIPADEVHMQGEFWCVTLWEVRANLIRKYGHAVGNRLMLQLVIDGMALSPPNPNYIESRDAILTAERINNGDVNHDEIWAGFAKRGLGGSATAPPSYTCVGVVESFDMPGLAVVRATADDSVAGNNNRAIDANECNDLTIMLRNGRRELVTGVRATLSCTNPNVVVSQPDSAYPNILPGGTAANLTPFRFYTTPAFPCGAAITFALHIQSSLEDRTNYFQMPSGYIGLNVMRFSNNIPVNIPDNNLAGVDSPVMVSGMSDPIGKVTVSLHATHTYVGDLIVQLISPDGATNTLSLLHGGFGWGFGTDCLAGRTTFDDNASTPISAGQAPYIGSFRPDEPLSVFNGKAGTNANGFWRLHVVDAALYDVGTLQCWTLTLYPTVCSDGGGDCASDLILQAAGAPDPVVVGSNLTYTLTVTNSRPVPASNVTITNVIPLSVTNVSAISSQGRVTITNGMVVAALGTLRNGVAATVTITVTPTVVGPLTNLFEVSASSGDRNLANNRVTVSTLVITPAPLVVAARAELIAESGLSTYGIEANERVTLNFYLRNIGSADTTNLVATLLAGNGIVAPDGPQTYGAIACFGQQTVARPFGFSAVSAPGSRITAVLRLSDNGINRGDVAFNFVLGSGGVFANPAGITIRDANVAAPYPSQIEVTGLVGVVSRVAVTLNKFTHSFPKDADVLLVSPSGQPIVLMSDVGGEAGVTNKYLTFEAAAAGPVPLDGPLVSGAYLPTDFADPTRADGFPAPAPAGPVSTSLTSLRAINPNGTWSLYVLDDTPMDSGSIAAGWSLNVSTVVPVNSNANLTVAVSDTPRPATVGGALTYLIGVTNLGPDTATGVVLSNNLPAGMSVVAATASQGTITTNGGALLFNLDALNASSNAVVTIVATPTNSGVRVNTATVLAMEIDLNDENNVSVTTTVVNDAAADLALRVVDLPDPVVLNRPLTYAVTVTNLGPNPASSVRLTSTLPAGVTFVSATNSQGALTAVGNQVIFNLGLLAESASATAAITVLPTVPGTLTNYMSVSSTTGDPVSTNNTVAVATTVVIPVPVLATAGSALVSESLVAPNNAIEPGETITINLALRNRGTGDTTNLVATLRAAGGVVLSAGPQARTYGTLIADGSSVSQPFTFTVTPTNADNLVVVLDLQDGQASLGAVSFLLPLSPVRTYANPAVILIPATGQPSGAASLYPSSIAVSNMTQTVSKVTVTLNRLSHDFISDLDVLLVGPNGQRVILMSDAGGESSVANINLTIDDDAEAALPNRGAVATGTYRPTDYTPLDEPVDLFPAPAPAGPYGTALTVFKGADPNGTWSLYLPDDSGGDNGRLDGGWSLSFITTRELPSAADLSVSTFAAPDPVQIGHPVTLTITVVNHGPSAATGVVLTNVLPEGFYLNSAPTISQGSVAQSANLLVCHLGLLDSGAAFTLTIVGSPTSAGILTNLVTVLGGESDPNAVNSLSLHTVISAPPRLLMAPLANYFFFGWPSLAAGYVLESSPVLLPGTNWQPVNLPVTTLGATNIVALPATNTGNLFFRLTKP